jgi:hypothetical protein
MRLALSLLLGAVLALTGGNLCTVDAKDKEIILKWSQTLPSPNDLKGWNIYCSESKGGPYKFLGFVPFSSEEAEYSWSSDRFDQLGFTKKGKLYFVLASVDVEGNVSGFSQETDVQVDFEPTGDASAPPVPANVSTSKK